MFTDLLYIISWEILRSGEKKECVFIDKECYNRQKSYLLEHKERYKILESYTLDMEEARYYG